MQFDSFDEDYLRRLAAGDAHTQKHFTAYFSAFMNVKLRSRLGSPQAIDDVRQETFARFFLALKQGQLQRPERLGSFVNSVCNNVLLDFYRVNACYSSLDDEEPKDLTDYDFDVLGALASRETQKKIREILQQLPERDRRLLREVFLEEKDKDEVCRDFGVDRRYLSVLLHRAKDAFRSLYLRNTARQMETLEAHGADC